MIPYSRQSISKQDIRAVQQVLRLDWLTQGPNVFAFEKALARYCRVPYAVAVSSGTAALHLAYLAAGLKKGDEVITTPNTFVATSNMLLAVGAEPVFCDIRLETYNLDETKLENLITRRTKAIVPVHFAGQPCEMDAILKIAKKHKLIVVEDACHALGASYRGNKIGSLSSDMTVFSFHAVKAITTGEGGAVITNNRQYYKRLLLLRSHGIYKNMQGKNVMTVLGYNYRLTDIQAALGLSQLKKLDWFIAKRRRVAEWYREELKDIEEIILPTPHEGSGSACHLYVIRVRNPKLRDRLWAYLQKRGIGANLHYPAVYSHPYYRKIGYRNLRLPNEEIYQHSCLTLPCHPTLKRNQVEYVCGAVKNFIKNYDL